MPAYHVGLRQEIRTEITDTYRTLIRLRRSNQAFVYGTFDVLNRSNDRFTYRRKYRGSEYIIDCNLGKKKRKSYQSRGGYEMIYSTTGCAGHWLESYEAHVWKREG